MGSNRRGQRKSSSVCFQAISETLEPRQLLSTTYYVSPTGSDGNAGTSSAAPWASVAKVNSTLFQPGDQILFQRGGEWHAQLEGSASGAVGNPIIYSDYGNTSLAKPTFFGSDTVAKGAFTSIGNSVYTFPTSASPNGNVYWVYLNHVALLAATSGNSSMPASSFYINGSAVYINTNGVDPTNVSSTTNTVSVGDRATGQNTDQGLVASNGFSNLVFNNLVGRETAEVGSGGNVSGGITDAYVFRAQGGSNITFSNDDAYYGGKHHFGAIDTTGFIALNCTAQGAVNGVAGNQLGYGNATALVAYADQNFHHTTQQWINCVVSNYSGSQPAFLTHNDGSDSLDSLLIQNLQSYGSPVALQPGTNVSITYKGGLITNNSLVAYTSAGTTTLIDGVSLTGDYPFIQVNGNATVQNCLVTNANQPAIQVNAGSNNVIRFNTLSPYGYATAIDLRSGTTNSSVYGNIITGTANAINIANASVTYSADYDFFDTSNGVPKFFVAGTTDTLAQFQAAGHETHGVAGNPTFTNSSIAPYDYSLKSNSPAINLIPAAGITGISTDIRGFTRPSGNVYDAGAYEFQSVLHQPTVATAAQASPSPVTGTSTNLSTLGASVDGEATLFYTWSTTGSPPAAVTFSANGTNAAKNTTATFTKAGSYYFQVTISNGSYSTTSSVAVTVTQTTQGIVITPTTALVAIYTTQQFSAIISDQFGNPVAGASVSYSVVSGNGTINSAGLYTAPSQTGSATIQASSGSYTANASVTVTPPNQAPTVATAASASPNPVSGTTTTLSVLGADDNGESNLAYTWVTLGNPPAAVSFSVNGTNAAKSTVATFTANGSYNFLVTIKDSGGLTVTSTVTVSVSTFVPIVLDGNLDGRYGTPISVQNVTTNVGSNGTNGVLGSGAKTAYTQLLAGYGIIDQQAGTFDLFLAGSFSLNNSHLDILIDSVPGMGAANLNALSTIPPYDNGSGFSSVVLDTGFRPDHIFTFAYSAGTSVNYYNFDTGAAASMNVSDPATTTITSSNGVPLFSERVNNAAVGSAVAPANAATTTTGAEFQFSLSGLNYTATNYSAGVPIRVQAIVTFGSHTQFSNQELAPLNATAAEMSANSLSYFGVDFSNESFFPGNQFFNVAVPTMVSGPTVATSAYATPNPVSAASTNLSVLGGSAAGESSLTYTWSIQGTPPAPVNFSINGTNTAKNTIATFSAAGSYTFVVTITDSSNRSTVSSVTVTVNAVPTVVSVPTTLATVAGGSTTQISVKDQFGNPTSSPDLAWSTTGGGSINSAGQFTADQSGGSYTVTATSGNTSASTTIKVVPTQFTGATGTDLYGIRLNAANPLLEEIFVNVPISANAPTYTIALSELANLTFAPVSNDGALTIDFSNGNALPVNGVTSAGASNLYIRGNATGGMAFSIDGSQIVYASAANSPIHYSNAQAIQFDLQGVSNTLTQLAQPSASIIYNPGTGNTLSVNGGAFTFAPATAGGGYRPLAFSGINIAASGSVAISTAPATADRSVLVLNTLSITPGGRLDLGGNDLILHTGSTQTVNTWLQSGLNLPAGYWNGPGISSSTAAAASPYLTTLGLLNNNQTGSPQFGPGTSRPLFDGQSPAPTDILIKYTYYGDADLSGVVDGNDYTMIDNAFGRPNITGWTNGDFNLDNSIDASDYTLIDNAFNRQTATLATSQADVSLPLTKVSAVFYRQAAPSTPSTFCDLAIDSNARDLFETQPPFLL